MVATDNKPSRFNIFSRIFSGQTPKPSAQVILRGRLNANDLQVINTRCVSRADDSFWRYEFTILSVDLRPYLRGVKDDVAIPLSADKRQAMEAHIQAVLRDCSVGVGNVRYNHRTTNGDVVFVVTVTASENHSI